MQDNQFHVSTGDEAETLTESILKAVFISLPVALQLITLFRRPKAATATVSLQSGLPGGTGDAATPPKVLTETK